jgi:hypothetical protein
VLLGQPSLRRNGFLFLYNGVCNGNAPCAVRWVPPALTVQSPQRPVFVALTVQCSACHVSPVLLTGRYGDYKAHFITQPALNKGPLPQCIPTDRNCTLVHYDPPLLFNIQRE